MKKIAISLISMALLSVAGSAYATTDDACMALGEARSHLVAMVDASDKGTQDDLKGKVHAASAKLECAGRPARSRWCKSIAMKE